MRRYTERTLLGEGEVIKCEMQHIQVRINTTAVVFFSSFACLVASDNMIRVLVSVHCEVYNSHAHIYNPAQ